MPSFFDKFKRNRKRAFNPRKSGVGVPLKSLDKKFGDDSKEETVRKRRKALSGADQRGDDAKVKKEFQARRKRLLSE